jgi:hypothetical protein
MPRQDGRIDWLLLRSEIDGDELDLSREEKHANEEAALVPFASRVQALAEARQRVEPIDDEKTAGELDALAKLVADERKALEKDPPQVAKSIAKRAADRAKSLRDALHRWYDFRAGYDPLFTWWMRVPYEALAKELEGHEKCLREKVAGLKDDEESKKDPALIVGNPIGREALLEDLHRAWIPYTPGAESRSPRRSSPGARRRCAAPRARWAAATTGSRRSSASSRTTSRPASNRR